MAGVRVLVGTRKGAFVLTSDERRRDWQVAGPQFDGWQSGGWEVMHLKGSPTDPDRVYAAGSLGWFGQVVHRSDDGGRSWTTVGNDFRYVGDPGPHQWYDGTPHPWEFARVWHLEPSLTDPDTVYAGVEDAALFRSTDAGVSWTELPGPARPRQRVVLAARRRRPVPAHHRPRPQRRAADVHGRLGRRRLPQRRRRQQLAADQQGPGVRRHPRRAGRGRPLRPQARPAPGAAADPVHAEALGRDAQRRRRRQLARGQRRPAHRLRLPDRRPRARARHRLRRPHHERLLPRRRRTARCASTAAAPAAASGSRSPGACRRSTAT